MVEDLVLLLFLRVSSFSVSSITVNVLFDSVFDTGVIVNSDFFFAFLVDADTDELVIVIGDDNTDVVVVEVRELGPTSNFGPTFAFLAPM